MLTGNLRGVVSNPLSPQKTAFIFLFVFSIRMDLNWLQKKLVKNSVQELLF